MKELLVPLMDEYKRLIEVENKYEEWKRNNSDKSSWEYKGQRIPRARFERIGVMIRQTMIDFEKNHSRF